MGPVVIISIMGVVRNLTLVVLRFSNIDRSSLDSGDTPRETSVSSSNSGRESRVREESPPLAR